MSFNAGQSHGAKRIAMKAKEDIEIRGTRGGLVIVADSGISAERLALALRAKLESSRGFFKGATCELHWEPARSDEGPEEVAQVLAEYGLELAPGRVESRERRGKAAESPMRVESKPMGTVTRLNVNDTLLHHGVLRGGQSLRYPGHIVIVGNVNPGAEVEAGGNVLVMGKLAGTVRAGCPDNRKAVVVAWGLAGQQISVGGQLLPPEAAAGPGAKVVRFSQGKVCVDDWEVML